MGEMSKSFLEWVVPKYLRFISTPLINEQCETAQKVREPTSSLLRHKEGFCLGSQI